MTGKWIYFDKKENDTIDYDPAHLLIISSSQIDKALLSRNPNTVVAPELLPYIKSHIHFPPRVRDVFDYSQLTVSMFVEKDSSVIPVLSRSNHPDFSLELIRVLSLAPDSILNGTSKKPGNKHYLFTFEFIRDEMIEPVPFDTTSPIYVFAEQNASFQGGDILKFREWVQKNVIYPPEAVEKGEFGRIMVRFVVTKEGEVTGIKILRGASPALDREVIRVLNFSPKWTSARSQGKNVDQQFVIPVIFMLQ
jgi:TonB family protein